MALEKHIISALLDSSLAAGQDQQLTGTNFQPKAAIILSTTASADGVYANSIGSAIAFATSPAEQCVTAIGESDGVGNMLAGRLSAANRATLACTSSGVRFYDHSLKSFDPDGLTLTVETPFSAPDRYASAFCLGGADIVNAKAGSFNLGNGTGPITDNSLGFQPDIAFFAVGNLSAFDVEVSSAASLGFGVSDGINQWFNSYSSQGAGVGTSSVARALFNDAGIGYHRYDGGVSWRASVTFTPTGISYNRTAPPANAFVIYLALQGTFNATVGTRTNDLSSGTNVDQQYIGIGFDPDTLVTSVNAMDSFGTEAHGRMSMGMATADEEFSHSFTSQTLAGTSNVQQIYTTADSVIQPSIFTPGLTQQSAFLKQFIADGWEFTWGEKAAASTIIPFAALGGSAAAQVITPDDVQVGSQLAGVNVKRRIFPEKQQVGTQLDDVATRRFIAVDDQQIGTLVDDVNIRLTGQITPEDVGVGTRLDDVSIRLQQRIAPAPVGVGTRLSDANIVAPVKVTPAPLGVGTFMLPAFVRRPEKAATAYVTRVAEQVRVTRVYESNRERIEE